MALGTDPVGSSHKYVDAKVKEYLERDYHQPSDEYETVALNLEGSRQYAEFVRDVTIAVANDEQTPSWLPGGEFARPRKQVATTRCAR